MIYNDRTATIVDYKSEQLVNITLPDGLIAIAFSAGYDSTALFYTICQYITDLKLESKITILPVHHWYSSQIDMFDKCEYIISRIKERYPNIKIEETEVYFDNTLYTSQKELHRQYWKDLFERYPDIKYLIKGKMSGPPKEVLDKWPQGWWNFDWQNILLQPSEYRLEGDTKHYHPFFNADKRMTKRIFDYLKIPKDVYQTIRACEVDYGLMKREEYVGTRYFPKEPCKTCYPCLHKKWAFGEF
jgi:hypothetical protein